MILIRDEKITAYEINALCSLTLWELNFACVSHELVRRIRIRTKEKIRYIVYEKSD